MENLPLSDIRVIDLGMAIATPVATKNLALLGAEVIHVESARRPDITRFGTPLDNQVTGEFWNKSGRYNSVNNNKKSLTLDLSKPRGVEILKKLIKLTDVVTENWAPRVKENLGLTYEELKEIKPDVILVSASGYGATGPWANWVAWGMAIDPMCGISHLTGFPDEPPIKASPPLSDIIAVGHVTLAVLACLEYRRRTGRGQWVDLSELEAAITHIGEAIVDYTMNNRVQTRIGNRHPFFAPHGCYPCKGEDKWVAISITSDEEWASLCNVMDNPGLAKDDRFLGSVSRSKEQDLLDKLIETWTRSKDAYEVMEMLQSVEVPSGVVLNCKEVLLDKHMQERECFPLVSHPEIEGTKGLGTRPCARLPWKLSEKSVPSPQPAPRFGEHNEYILGQLLGLSKREILELEREGVIGTTPLTGQKGVHATYPIPKMLETGVIRGYDPNYMEILGIEPR